MDKNRELDYALQEDCKIGLEVASIINGFNRERLTHYTDPTYSHVHTEDNTIHVHFNLSCIKMH